MIGGMTTKSTGIIGHWPLDGNHIALPTAKDISRFGNDGVCTDVSLTTGIHGESNGAALFNGTTSGIDTGTDMIGIGPLTIDVWIYLTGWGESGSGRVINNRRLIFHVYEEYGIKFTSDGSRGAYPAEGAIVFNTWYHTCITRDINGIANIYLNGVLSGAANQDSGIPVAGESNVFIGALSFLSRFFDGKIAKVRIYSYVMSAGQVAKLYESYGV